ncbi:helix-turn-helix domain-containing protein [Heliobacterium gestii]|uniref:Helix-turn-helix domain-containing protein n=1 Tax=Heliomicrobium gestii TaxID=2699 RepID=A0A845L8S2_HELGE|nr:helix-turn-helix domain-containing protein [Heliomicrobium gestii]MBM7865744.1 putative ArsR family transcriptional regulator [Heliomicrobium gestii]MZP41991.1 helix-turn-helix domain-containing protein [Heliomicrobium gestii]
MFEDAQKVSSVFADRTRFSIYQYIVNHPNATCTVKEIAQEFSIHPNVARLHLSKLEEIGLLESGWDHQSMPGRPGRVYSLRKKAITLHFPPREYQLLCDLTLDALDEVGAAGMAALNKVGRAHGVRLAQGLQSNSSAGSSSASTGNAAGATHGNASPEGAFDAMLTIESLAISAVTRNETGAIIRLRNCPFRESAERRHHLTCPLHRAILSGVWETLFEPAVLASLSCQALGDACCEIGVHPGSQSEAVGEEVGA